MNTNQAFVERKHSLTNTVTSANQLVGRGFAVQNKLDNNQTDLKTQLKQATHFGHNLGRMNLEQTDQSAKQDQNHQNSSVIQQKNPKKSKSASRKRNGKKRERREQAKNTAEHYDQPLEPISDKEKQAGVNRSTHGHGNQRHGHQTTDSQHEDRVRNAKKTEFKSSRFTSPLAETQALRLGRKALNKALKQQDEVQFSDSGFVDPNTGQPARHAVEVSTSRKNGFGVQAGKVKQKDPKTKKPVTKIQMNSQPLQKARIVYEYVPSAKTWRPLTYFPI